MSAVLRIALTYFDMLGPIQRWLSALGLVFLLCAGALIAQGAVPGAVDDIYGLCTGGVMMILIVPVFSAGTAMRLASRPGIVHLRPFGRLRMLLGTTLATTLFAVVATLPSFATYGFLAMHDLGPHQRFPLPGTTFPLMWAGCVSCLIFSFAMSRSMIGAMMFWLLPLAFAQLVRHADSWSASVSPAVLLVTGLTAWLLFALWYLRVATIAPPAATFSGSSNTTAETSPFRWLLTRESGATTPTRQVAVLQYLFGSASIRHFVLTGLWIAAFFALVHFLSAENRGQPGQLLFMLPFLAFLFGAMGYTTARRMRLLWLRAGVTRAGQFSLAERRGLLASLITWGIVAATALVVTVLRDPSNLAAALLSAGAQAVVGICAFYVGMATVKPWTVGDMALAVLLGVLFVVQVVAGQYALRDGHVAATAGYTALFAGVLAIALRLLAARRWRALDWRLAKPLNLQARGS